MRGDTIKTGTVYVLSVVVGLSTALADDPTSIGHTSALANEPTSIGHTSCQAYAAAGNSYSGARNKVDVLYYDATTWLDGYVLTQTASEGSLVSNIKKNNDELNMMILEWSMSYCQKHHPDLSVKDAGYYMIHGK